MKKLETSNVTNWDLIKIGVNTPLIEAFQKMNRYQIRHLPVMDSEHNIVGILSDRDVQRALKVEIWNGPGMTRIEDCQFNNEVAEDFMSWPVKTIPAEASLSEAAELMIKHKISSVLVLGQDSKVGIVTHEDLLKILIQRLGLRDR